MIDLNKFCSKDPLKFKWMAKPFTQGGISWAINGYLAIGVPIISSIPENKAAFDISKYNKSVKPAQWFNIPEIFSQKCDYCDGKGVNFKCPECNGTGKYWGEDCTGCDGNKKQVFCYKCIGTGVDMLPLVKINGVSFTVTMLYMIKDLPGIEVCPLSGKDPALLRFDAGGMGFIMPAYDIV